MKAFIVDDEINGVSTLKILIENYAEGVEVAGYATEPQLAIDQINQIKPDILFVDISMPGMNGFELIDQLNHQEYQLVFTTAHEEFAVKALRKKACDYLLKPIDIQELKECIARLHEAAFPDNTSNTKRMIGFPVKDGILYLKADEIIRLEAAGSYTIVYADTGHAHTISRNLKECSLQLPTSQFFRSHNSHLINMKKVMKLISTDGLYVLMEDNSAPEISRKNKDEFLRRLKRMNNSEE